MRLRVQQAARSEPGAAESIPFTPEARQALHGSLAQAMDLGSGYIGTGHILLALLSQGQSAAARILSELGVAAGPAREQVGRLAEPGLTDEQPPLIQGFSPPLAPARRRRWRR